ncbi:hypothetical protein ABVT39_027434 [Epinephelus coioides]
MAQRGVELDRETLSCSICLDLLKDPGTLPCGHSYCINCIQSFWDGEDEKRIYSCPQCHDTVSAAAERTERQRELEGSRQNIQQRIQDTEKDVKLLQQEVEAISRSADKAVEHSEKIFTELIRLMEKRRSDVKQQLRWQQETESVAELLLGEIGARLAPLVRGGETRTIHTQSTEQRQDERRNAEVGVEKDGKVLLTVNTEELWKKRNCSSRFGSVWWTTEKRPWEFYLAGFFGDSGFWILSLDGRWRANRVIN